MHPHRATLHIVVCYDITDDGRRKRLHDQLHAFIERVQFSVFEGMVKPRDYARVVQLIEDTIDRSEDNVRIYRLCRGCSGHLEIFGKAFSVQRQPEDVIIG
jgi:CRISPR-associated protein Cas2